VASWRVLSRSVEALRSEGFRSSTRDHVMGSKRNVMQSRQLRRDTHVLGSKKGRFQRAMAGS
jgi:hypothetical protein